ncbi:MAG TPA: 23S rRNA (uracil(1939)-C(5))-methyltransferase RlmD [Steroidobacteraceae bacterium]|nr:23S rRNA (uracil(1939)-C(5))-methyltransferase RlmD [Steroidobacteraceae bacterium]
MNARARTRSDRRVETAEIIDLAHDGRGVARVEGKTVFIDDALPGERVEWSRRKRSRNFDEGRLQRVLEPAADRVEPRCAHFGVCGGCVLQHLAPPRQLEFKQRQLFEALTRIGKVTPAQMLPPLQGGVWNYRRRARLAARWVPKKERTVVGFRERSTSFIADVKRCEVLLPPVDSLVEPLSLLLTALSVRNRVPQIEVAIADNAVALMVRILEDLTPQDRELLLQFAREHAVQIYVQPGGYETIAPLTEVTPLEYRLPQFDVTLRFQPNDFIQVNGELNARMVARALELLAPAPGEQVLDLFCGLGNFSLPLARSGAHVVGIEGDAGLVARARANAELNGIANVDFVCGDLAQPSASDAAWARRGYDKVLLDPPRAGAQEVLPIVTRCGAKVVLYISCHPGTLARDAGILVHEHGFTLRAAGVMDMFPHTAHVESAALFIRG